MHELLVVVFASIALGCPVNGLDPSFGRTELLHMLKTTKPTLICCDVQCYDLVYESLKELDSEARQSIFTFGGSKGDSEPVENLFAETHTEHQFL